MSKNTTRVVTRASDGTLRIKDYPSTDALLEFHTQIGIDDCSTDLALRGLPVFRGLIGPMPEGKDVVRYESPEVFETLTKEWSSSKPVRRTRRRTSDRCRHRHVGRRRDGIIRCPVWPHRAARDHKRRDGGWLPAVAQDANRMWLPDVAPER